MNRTHRVTVLFPETPQRLKYVESPAHGFTVKARTFDAAAELARARVEANGIKVRFVSHSPGHKITITGEPVTASKAVRA